MSKASRTTCLRLVGPGDKVLGRVDMVLMGPAEPLKVPLTLGVEGRFRFIWYGFILAEQGRSRRYRESSGETAMVAIKTEITVTYTPILNLSAVGRDLATPYMIYGGVAQIKEVGRPGERIILIFEEDGFIIDFNWLRIVFTGQSSREGYDDENGPLRFFFELVAKIEKLPGFGKIKELKLDTWDVIEVSEGAMADPVAFKKKYLSTQSYSTKGDFEDLSLNLVYKSPSRSWSWVFGPYKKKADWDKHDLLVFTQRNIDDLINKDGILSNVLITDTGSKANHKLYLSLYKDAKDILSGIV